MRRRRGGDAEHRAGGRLAAVHPGGTAGIFFLLGADFVGATQLLVYVGGTLVLVVFGVMLTAQGPFINMKISAAEWAIAAWSSACCSTPCWPSACLQTQHGRRATRPSGDAVVPRQHVVIGEALLGVEEATPEADVTGVPGARRAGRRCSRTRMSYLLPFEIVSVHLLVVLIGAAYLARAKRRRGAAS